MPEALWLDDSLVQSSGQPPKPGTVSDLVIRGLTTASPHELHIVLSSEAKVRQLTQGATWPSQVPPTVLATLVPSEQKVEWVLQVLPHETKAAMGEELFRIATKACATGDLWALTYGVLSWEATAEEIVDSQNPEAIRDADEVDTPVSLDELRKQLEA